MPCPLEPHNTLNCSCPRESTMILGSDATLYPKAGCFRVGRVLLNARSLYSSIGEHVWEMLIHNPPGISQRMLFPDGGFNMICVCIKLEATGGGIAFALEPYIDNRLMPLTCVCRIQRAIRHYLERQKFEWRALAVMMAAHPRLGDQSCLQMIPEDVLCRQIIIPFLGR